MGDPYAFNGPRIATSKIRVTKTSYPYGTKFFGLGIEERECRNSRGRLKKKWNLTNLKTPRVSSKKYVLNPSVWIFSGIGCFKSYLIINNLFP